VPIWRALVTPVVCDDTQEGEALRRKLAASFDVNHRRMHGMVGVEAAYSYAGSPLIADEPGNVAEWETSSYTPHTRPGVRIPHMWLNDGRAMQDILGDDYTLLDLRGDCDAGPLIAAFRGLKAPLAVLRLDEPRVRGVYGASVFLFRPDLHIAWRGNEASSDPARLAALATGHYHTVRGARSPSRGDCSNVGEQQVHLLAAQLVLSRASLCRTGDRSGAGLVEFYFDTGGLRG
jgi:hypothetical protein